MSDAIMRTTINRKGNCFGSTGNKDNHNLKRKEWNKDKQKRVKKLVWVFFSVMQEVHGTSYKVGKWFPPSVSKVLP